MSTAPLTADLFTVTTKGDRRQYFFDGQFVFKVNARFQRDSDSMQKELNSYADRLEVAYSKVVKQEYLDKLKEIEPVLRTLHNRGMLPHSTAAFAEFTSNFYANDNPYMNMADSLGFDGGSRLVGRTKETNLWGSFVIMVNIDTGDVALPKTRNKEQMSIDELANRIRRGEIEKGTANGYCYQMEVMAKEIENYIKKVEDFVDTL